MSDSREADRWWDFLEPVRRVQIHRWIENPVHVATIPGQIPLIDVEKGKEQEK
ncbi:hypothetical protein [Corynebacterium renale]|uniref:hypothetical protein n=1 Tax=Corynebacterium renale TaxID=1724 RepID=UPI001379161F|nr:hypothetical protein [Corynebacterium renale]